MKVLANATQLRGSPLIAPFLSARVRSVVAAAVFSGLACSAYAQQTNGASTEKDAPVAQIIDLNKLKYNDMGPAVAGHGSVRSKTLVTTPEGTIALQIGEAPKHTHQKSVEVQYVVSGSGTFWLGDKPHHVHPGDLIVVPENTVHAGAHPNKGHFKTISIKFPPPVAGDSQWVK